MVKTDDAFLTRLLATFRIEAQEHLDAIAAILLQLEGPAAADRHQELVETLFREAHSLKGAARAVNLVEVEAICQALEDVLAQLQAQEIALSVDLFNNLHQVVDGLSGLLARAESEHGLDRNPMADLLRRLKQGQNAAAAQPQTGQMLKEGMKAADIMNPDRPPGAVAAQRLPPSQTVRIATAKLDALLYQAEELLPLKLACAQLATELSALSAATVAWKRRWTLTARHVRALQRRLENSNSGDAGQGRHEAQLRRLLRDWERDETLVKWLEGKLALLAAMADQGHRTLAGMVDTLLDDMREALMLPFTSLLGSFPKLVRDLSQELGKAVDCVIQGGELEADRRLLEELKDPLIHLVRNCIDHGIEVPEERKHKSKPPRGTITIAIAAKNGSKVEVCVCDDGAGIDLAKVLATAVRLGIVTPGEASSLGGQQALSLIFASGLSTSPFVTDISGRGLGLAIVREKIEKLGGTLSVETHSEAGTLFRMLLPVTLATFRGLLVRVDERLFMLPTTPVERVITVAGEAIKAVGNRETIALEGQSVALVRLRDVLQLPSKERPSMGRAGGDGQGIVLAVAAMRMVFLVDEVIQEQEVLVRGLGPQLRRVRNLAGAAVLGTGKIVPVLNAADLVKSAIKGAAAGIAMPAIEERHGSILVVEDSITSRMLLKNILESAGYEVVTAVDGIDALETLRTQAFDLIVTDVEMPRMDGFDLTAKIRADPQWAELPVVLVTTLGSAEHRQRGMSVGANAYIVKSGFDQGNLLEIIRRLL